MADITFYKPNDGENFHAIFWENEQRSKEGTGIKSGYNVHQTASPSMAVTVDAGIAVVDGTTVLDNETTISIDAADTNNLYRIDTIYRSASAIAVWKGVNAEKSDPKGAGLWRQYFTPIPKANCPAGTILALVLVRPNATTIVNGDIWMIGVKPGLKFDEDRLDVLRSKIRLGNVNTPVDGYPSGNNSYLVIDKNGSTADASIVLRDEGNARAEIGIVSDNKIHIKTVTGTYPSETFIDRAIITPGGAFDLFNGIFRNYATSGIVSAILGNSDLSSAGAGLELSYEFSNLLSRITSIERGNSYRNLVIEAYDVLIRTGTTTLADALKLTHDGITQLFGHNVIYGSVAPAAGTWVVGDICFNSAPSADGAVGWVCISAGTPGTWASFGDEQGPCIEIYYKGSNIVAQDANGYIFQSLSITPAHVATVINAALHTGATDADGPRVHLGDGTFITNQLSITRHGTELFGNGKTKTILKLADTQNVSLLIDDQSNGYNWMDLHIHNLTIDGNKTNNTAGHGVYLHPWRSRFHDIYIKNCKEMGFFLEDLSGHSTDDNKVWRVDVESNGHDGIHVLTPVCHIDNCIACLNGWDQIYVHGDGIEITNNQLYYIAGGYGITYDRGRNGLIAFNKLALEYTTSYGILLESQSIGDLTGIQVYQNQVRAFYQAAQEGIRVDVKDTSTASDLQIYDNNIQTLDAGSLAAGIKVTKASGAAIATTDIRGNSLIGTITSKYTLTDGCTVHQNPGSNRLMGITPTATLWDVAPTNLANATDGDYTNPTGTGNKIVTTNGWYGCLTFDLGHLTNFILTGLVGIGSDIAWGQAQLDLEYSLNGTDWISAGPQNEGILANYYNATITNCPIGPLFIHARYFRLCWNAKSGAGTYYGNVSNLQIEDV